MFVLISIVLLVLLHRPLQFEKQEERRRVVFVGMLLPLQSAIEQTIGLHRMNLKVALQFCIFDVGMRPTHQLE